METFAFQKTGIVAIMIFIAWPDFNAVILLFVVITLMYVVAITVVSSYAVERAAVNPVNIAAPAMFAVLMAMTAAARAAANPANIAAPGMFAVLMTMTAAGIIAVPRGTNVVGRPAASLHRPAVVTTAVQPASTVAIPLQGAVMIRILQAARRIRIHATAKSVAAIAYPGIINVVLVEAGGVLLTKNAVLKASGVVL